MATVHVERTSTVPDGWDFLVRVRERDGETHHRVTLARADWQRLTGQSVQPEVLVDKTSNFCWRENPGTASYAVST
ncbi:MAG TPA: hypothetical protein VK009_19430 [Chloroflexota bacterium]|nr:hypothetical protein [Chloroflexota bacterium]